MKSTLGQRLRQSRDTLHWTQDQLSKASGVNVMALSHFECNRRAPNIRNAVRLCEALHCSMDWLTRGIRD